MARILHPYRARHVIETPRLLIQVHRSMAGLNILVVRPPGHVEVPIRGQFARIRVVFNVVCFNGPVAVRDHHIAIQDIAAPQLRLCIRFHLHCRRIIGRRHHLGLRIPCRPRLIRQVRRRAGQIGRSCLIRHLLRRQMWMTCRNQRGSYQEVNSFQGAADEASR